MSGQGSLAGLRKQPEKGRPSTICHADAGQTRAGPAGRVRGGIWGMAWNDGGVSGGVWGASGAG